MSRRFIVPIAAFVLLATNAFAQPKPTDQQSIEPQSDDNPSGSVTQPQGRTGPIVTKSGGAPPSSPQGETPAGMQAAPEGSDKAIRTDKNGVVEGTPKN